MYLTTVFLALAAGCGDAPREEDNTGSVQMLGTMAQAITAADVTEVRVTVSAPDMTPRTEKLVKTNNQWSGTIGKLPAGRDRTFTAEAFNSSNVKLYAGQTTRDILPKQVMAVQITLQEVNPAPPFANAAPVVTALSASPGNVEPGGTVALNASASDANPGDTLTYAWTAPAGSFASPGSLSSLWTAPSSSSGTVPLTLTVTDSKGAQGRVTVNVNVNSGRGDANVTASFNTWPQVNNISATATAIEVNEPTVLSTAATDNDGDPLSYQWTDSCSGSWSNANSASAQFTATTLPASDVCNNCDVTVTVTDGRGGQTTGTFSICVGPKKTAVYSPEITGTFQSVNRAVGGTVATVHVAAQDPQDSALSFSWTANLGTLDTPTEGTNTSEVRWTAPSCVHADESPTVSVNVSNALGVPTTHTFAISWEGELCPASLAFETQPGNTLAGGTLSPAVQVSVLDRLGRVLPTATHPITLALGNNPGGGQLSGTLTVSASSGTATFSNLSIDRAGTGYSLIASASGLSPVTSSSFNIGGGTCPQPTTACPSNVTSYRGQNGTTISCQCGAVQSGIRAGWGVDVYTDDSSTCAAAVHAGAIPLSGGYITATILPGQGSYSSSSRNGVYTTSYGPWGGSVSFTSWSCP